MFAGQFGRSFTGVSQWSQAFSGAEAGWEKREVCVLHWGREQLWRLRQSVGDQACHSSISALVAIGHWHNAKVLSWRRFKLFCGHLADILKRGFMRK